MSTATDRIRIPRAERAPLAAVTRRIGLAITLVVFIALVVLVGRDGYVDVTGDAIGLLDAMYYASVTVTTTGYGDITAITSGARLATIVLITPARILFLILVVGTTVEVLTDQSREFLAIRRWRKRVNNHTVICGFGSTGQAAARELVNRGIDRDQIVAVDRSPAALEAAAAQGFVAIDGDATKRAVLELAGVVDAKSIIIAPSRDDTAVLITLTIRELNPDAHIVTGGREQENLHLLRQGGANEVVDATAAVGRMLGLATTAPGAVEVLDDLIDSSHGLKLTEARPHVNGDVVEAPLGATVVAIIREGKKLKSTDAAAETLHATDRLVVLADDGT